MEPVRLSSVCERSRHVKLAFSHVSGSIWVESYFECAKWFLRFKFVYLLTALKWKTSGCIWMGGITAEVVLSQGNTSQGLGALWVMPTVAFKRLRFDCDLAVCIPTYPCAIL